MPSRRRCASLSRPIAVQPSISQTHRSRTLSAAVAPVVANRAVAEIAAVGFLDQKSHEPLTAEFVRKVECCRLVDPHQRRMDHEAPLHAEIERKLHGFDRVVAAIRIPRIVGLAHACHEMLDSTAVGESAGKREEHEIAPGHERSGKPALAHCDRDVAGEGAFREGRERGDLDHVILTQTSCPWRAHRADALAHAPADDELHSMTLAVIEADGLYALESMQCPDKTHGRILPSGKEHNRRVRIRGIHRRSRPIGASQPHRAGAPSAVNLKFLSLLAASSFRNFKFKTALES